MCLVLSEFQKSPENSLLMVMLYLELDSAAAWILHRSLAVLTQTRITAGWVSGVGCTWDTDTSHTVL